MSDQTSQAVDMSKQIARFADLKPTSRALSAGNGVPAEAYEMLAAKEIFLLMAPEGNVRKSSKPAVTGAPGAEISIVRCPPGNGPGLHNHRETNETFICLSGEWEVSWGEKGDSKTTIKPYDLVAMPPGIFRAFKNVSSEPAHLLVVVQGPKEAVMGDISYSRELGKEIARKFGPEAEKGLKEIGITFGSPATAA